MNGKRGSNGEYWSRVFEVADALEVTLRAIARNKKWEAAVRCDHSRGPYGRLRRGRGDTLLIAVAQTVVIAQDSWRPLEETKDAKALRLAARAYVRNLSRLHNDLTRRGYAVDLRHLQFIEDNIVGARFFSEPLIVEMEVVLAQRILQALALINRRDPKISPRRWVPRCPTGLGSHDLVVGLVCAAMDILAPEAAADEEAVRKFLTARRSEFEFDAVDFEE
jgi:hypothetical protein